MSEHTHNHGDEKIRTSLKIALIPLIVILILEIIGGILSNSLALLSDAVHVFMDIFAISLSFFALQLICKLPNNKLTYGYHRSEILASLINGITLIAISIFIFYESYLRILSPPKVIGGLMFIIAFIGFIVNLIVVLILHNTSKRNLNIRSAYLHVLGDTLSSIAVIIGGVVIIYTSFYLIDAILSILIGLLIFYGSYKLIIESVNIIMEGVPKGMKIEDITKEISALNGVENVHDIHAWSLCSDIHSLSCHILVKDCSVSETEKIKNKINEILKKFEITHTTLQFECSECNLKECNVQHGGV